jgi:thiol-disulfide isomerase/thioredoxin
MSAIGLTVIILVVINCAVAGGVYSMIRADSAGSSSHSSNTTNTSQTTQTSSPSSVLDNTTSVASSFTPTCNPVESSESNMTQVSLNEPISQGLYSELSGVSCTTLSSIGRLQNVSSFSTVNGSALILNGKPEILYIGAEYCPYCAAERWSLIVALSKFGIFSGLEYMLSSSNDIFPNTPTFSFLNATYTSPYISFVSVEAQDRNRNSLQQITTSEQALLNKYDSSERIPFADISNQFVLVSSQYSPGTLNGASWNQVASQLNNSSNSYAINIDGASNIIIADVCAVDGNNPSIICDQSFAKTSSVALSFITMQAYFETYLATLGFLLLAIVPFWTSEYIKMLKASQRTSIACRLEHCLTSSVRYLLL